MTLPKADQKLDAAAQSFKKQFGSRQTVVIGLSTVSKISLTKSCGEIRTAWPVKVEKQSVFHRNLGGGVGFPARLRKRLWNQRAPEPLIYLLERATGIEPASSAWKAGVLPLNYARKIWSGRQDLNLRHPAPKAGALPNCATSRRC